jgi:hypothetical protein
MVVLIEPYRLHLLYTIRHAVPIGETVTTKGTGQMAFDLSHYIPFNMFVLLWILGMLAGATLFNRNDREGK